MIVTYRTPCSCGLCWDDRLADFPDEPMRFACDRCGLTVPWCFSTDDSMPDSCDACWAAALAEQALEQAAEARQEACACRALRKPAKADRWDHVGAALEDAAEAFQRASDEIGAVATEQEAPLLVKRCGRGRAAGCPNAATDPHSCPYKSDINGDSTSLCECCEGCQESCAADI